MGLTRADVPGLQAWLTDAPHVADGGVTFTRDLVAALHDRGAPLWRCSVSLMTMHPELVWRNLQWREGEGVRILERQHETLGTPFYMRSPVPLLRQGHSPVRVPLVPGPLAFPICEDLRDEGGTDYYAQGLRFSHGEIGYVSWATREPGGFDDETLRALDALVPSLARRVELESAYHATRALLEVYLGANAARHVLGGKFRRGDGERIEAVVWFCDLRDFTALSDRLPASHVLAILDAYFDCVAGAVVDHGGEVLKFVGDAVLAIFPVRGEPAGACRDALRAATSALEALTRLNEARATSPGGALAIGVALHLGAVTYGNIGSRRRLDFTVISPSVNEACRLEALCKPLQTPLVLSDAFVRAVPDERVVDLGPHVLKGVSAPARVFTLERYRPQEPQA